MLSVERLCMSFGGLRALHEVSLTIEAKSTTGIVGPNGAGKTTLFNCMTGHYKPQTGDIRLENRSIVGLPPHRVAKRGVARTFQNLELFARMSVLENVLLGRHIRMHSGFLACAAFSRRARDEEARERHRVEEILELLDLQSVRKRTVGSLSYGMRKKVELARALAIEPQLLLLDEPSAGMNGEEKIEFRHVVSDIKAERALTIAIVEHDMGLVRDLCDHVVVLDHGEGIASGTPDEIARDERVLKAYLGTPTSDAVPAKNAS